MRPVIPALVLLASLLAGCGSSEPPVPAYLFFGTATSTSVDASGAWVYLRLVGPDGRLEDTPAYIARCQLAGPSCDYQINRVTEGSYKVYGLIDLDGDADRLDPLPGQGDLFSQGRSLLMWSRQQLDFPDDAWLLLP